MKYVPREIVDEVNITPVHPLVNFGHLLATVAAAAGVVYAGLGIAGAQIAARIGPGAESKLGQMMFENVFTGLPLVETKTDYAYVQRLAEDLRSDALTKRPDIKLYIFEDPLPNAMVSAGGYIFVSTGLLDSVETENELAFVLAHELGHYENRDNLRSLGRSIVFLSLNSTLAASGVRLPPFLMSSMSLADLSYSRDQEQRADVYALEIMHERYGHVNYATDFFEGLVDWELDLGVANQFLEWRSTHPLTESRIDYLEAVAAQRGWSLEGEPTALPGQ